MLDLLGGNDNDSVLYLNWWLTYTETCHSMTLLRTLDDLGLYKVFIFLSHVPRYYRYSNSVRRRSCIFFIHLAFLGHESVFRVYGISIDILLVTQQ